MQNNEFELCLFNTDPVFIKKADQAGICTFIVDWECEGKKLRQQGFDTQINQHTLQDLKIVRNATKSQVICRINAIGKNTEEELLKAIKIGVDEILIPMVRSVKEVKWVLDYVKGKAKVGILIETKEAVVKAAQFSKLSLNRIYVGLNDWAIENSRKNIFFPIASGELEQLRKEISLPFGFGGVTLPDLGFPIPAKLLIAEIFRLNCHFSFLRRSFLKDIHEKDLSLEVKKLKEFFLLMQTRSFLNIESDRKKLILKILSFDALC